VYINIYANKCKPKSLVALLLVSFFLIFSFDSLNMSHDKLFSTNGSIHIRSMKMTTWIICEKLGKVLYHFNLSYVVMYTVLYNKHLIGTIMDQLTCILLSIFFSYLKHLSGSSTSALKRTLSSF